MDSMYPNVPNQWPQNVPDSQHVHVDGAPPSNDDWKDRSAPNTSAGGSTAAQPLDLSDFGLGDIPGPTSTSTSISSPPQPYYAHAHPYQSFYISTVPAPYNAMAYGSMSWTGASAPLPLSSYSTLNGATTSTSQQQIASPPPLPPPQPQLMIDPALTTINDTETTRPYSQSSSQVVPATQQTPRQQQPQYQYQQPTLSINPSYVLPSHFYSHSPQHQHAQSQSQPATLSPHVLHSPSTSMAGILSSFYSPSTSSASTSTSAVSINPQARKDKFSADIRPLLQPNSFTGAGAVSSLVLHIDDFGSQDIDPITRLEILTKIRDNAGNHYFRAWLENVTAMDITREWLKVGLMAKSDSILVETIMPLLHIVDRLPMTIDSLKASKLGKIIVKLVKEPPAPAIKDMASNLERKWRLLVETATKQAESNPTEDVKIKKRKLSEPPAAKAPPAKKAAVTTAPSSSKVTVKKEAKSVSLPVKDSRSDSSFFSAPKPKPKLPSFKKAPVSVKKEPDTNVAQPSSIDPFQEALKSMGKGRKASPVVSTPPVPAASTPPITYATGKTKRKTVSWAPEGQLESIRLIERAVYDDDPVDGIHTTHSLRDLDRGEGAALHAHLFEELIDWTDPITIDIPIDIELMPRGLESVEKIAQAEREQTALGALYMNAAQIPDSPAELAATISEEDVDASVKMMTVGAESDIVFWSGIAQIPQVSVADLVNQLAAGGVDHPMDGSTVGGGGGGGVPVVFDPNILSSIPPEQMQQLMQQAQALLNPGQASGGGGQPPPFGGASQMPDWNVPGQFQELGQEFGEDDASVRARWAADRGRGRGMRGRGGRGRGDEGSYRSSKRRPCSFFAEGRRASITFECETGKKLTHPCRYGDQCDFSHEPIF
ncbi:hypothetical protein L210DRAFT_3470435 [Boletus edulis BED1]|uniref:Serine/threonine-protein phosphatase 1 regulatory subunit 10 n=1 Tax=Boletus edulis BED1 TaxID=1328754 RepID=A0AAD4GKT8_BOLED|nr:hypothetical protein L210DRAFT_3470435 [Boletus edulis BED1]